eukprot:6102458-Amphidinium_carterae.1
MKKRSGNGIPPMATAFRTTTLSLTSSGGKCMKAMRSGRFHSQVRTFQKTTSTKGRRQRSQNQRNPFRRYRSSCRHPGQSTRRPST